MCDKYDEKCDLSNLSEYDIKINQLKYDELYNGTVLICIIYGLFAIGILTGSYFNETFRDIFFNQFIIFTVIFIIGSIIIISMMCYFIIYYKPKKTKHYNTYDSYSCPDYWNLVMLDDKEVYKNFDSNISPNYFKYKCVLNPDIFNKYEIYKTTPDLNYKQLNYSLTNNLSNTIKLNTDHNGDYYNSASVYDTKIKNNINDNNIGHLYKNINDINIFPPIKDGNNYAYNKPGNVISDNYLSNIKNAIIDTSLKMNNYRLDTSTNNYSNIPYNSLSDKIDPYIMWNYNNEPEDIVGAKYNLKTNATHQINSQYYEHYSVYKWIYNDITKITYDDYFTTGYNNRKVYAKLKQNTAGDLEILNIGTLIRDEETKNIYFQSKIITGANKNRMISQDIDANNNNNYIIESYVWTDIRDDPTTNTHLTTNPLSRKGPMILVDNGYGRPPAITKDDIKNNNKNIPVVCDTVYPAYLASIEDQNVYGSDNSIRCSYAKLCGYSWSDMGCN